jgi:hypothetical protein
VWEFIFGLTIVKNETTFVVTENTDARPLAAVDEARKCSDIPKRNDISQDKWLKVLGE